MRGRWGLLCVAWAILQACGDDDSAPGDGGSTGGQGPDAAETGGRHASGGAAPNTGGRAGGAAPDTGGRAGGGAPDSGGAAPTGGVSTDGGNTDASQESGGTTGTGGDAGDSSVHDDASDGRAADGGATDGGEPDADDGGSGRIPLTVVAGECQGSVAVVIWYAGGSQDGAQCASGQTCVYWLESGTSADVICHSPGQTYEPYGSVQPPLGPLAVCSTDYLQGNPTHLCSTTLPVPTTVTIGWRQNPCWPSTCP